MLLLLEINFLHLILPVALLLAGWPPPLPRTHPFHRGGGLMLWPWPWQGGWGGDPEPGTYMERQRCYYSKSFGCKVLPFSNHHLRVLEVALLNEVWRKPCFHHRRILAAGSLKRRGVGLSTKVPRHQWLLAGGGLASWHCCGWYSEQRCSRDARFCKTGQNNGWPREDNTTSYQSFQELPSKIC